METTQEIGGIVVAFLAFFVLFFGFAAIPTGSPIGWSGVALLTGFMSAGVGLVFHVLVNDVYKAIKHIVSKQ